MPKTVGVSILTNGKRRKDLEQCVQRFLTNCHYRPLIIGIVNNGSTDDTKEWLDNITPVYGVTWRVANLPDDKGCANGTNMSIELVADCEYQIHLESDFWHLSQDQTGQDPMWMHRAVDFMDENPCDYLYLRRMRDEKESAMHWWFQWMPKIDLDCGDYMQCPSFWWTNNPVLFRYQALKDQGVLPLDASKDGPKGTEGWSLPEMSTGRPKNTWIHKWGMFVHEVQPEETFEATGCGLFGPFGKSGCKYGFWKDGNDSFCQKCDKMSGYREMEAHRNRQIQRIEVREPCTVAFHSNQLVYGGVDISVWNYAVNNEEVLGNRSVVLTKRDADHTLLDMFQSRFDVLLYDTWNEADAWLQEKNTNLLHMRKFGHDDGLISSHCRTVVHCAHKVREEHGDVYCYISEWLSNVMSHGQLPWIPHIVRAPKVMPDLRDKLGIPRNALVLGWIGREGSFNLEAGFNAVKSFAGSKDVWFLFLGLKPFVKADNVVFLDPTWNDDIKSAFTYTCDAMLHSRWEGDSFGLAVAEFSAAGRPVVVWNGGVAEAHIDMLGSSAILYNDERELKNIINGWDYSVGSQWDVFTNRFSPQKVMAKFKSVCGI